MVLCGGDGSAAWARGEGGGGSLVSVAGGIAAPAAATAVFQNPAGMTGINQFGLVGTAGFPSSIGDDGSFGLGVEGGQPGYGFSAGAIDRTAGSGSTRAYYGLAVESQSLQTSLGVAGQTPLSPSGDSSFDLGLLFNASANLRIGLTAIDIGRDVGEFGLGFAAAFAADAWFVTDLTLDHRLNNPVVAPGLRVGGDQAQLGVSYGFKLGSDDPFASREIPDGFSVGGGLRLGQRVTWALYYKELSKYFTALTISL